MSDTTNNTSHTSLTTNHTPGQLCPTAHLSAFARQRAVDFILEHGTNLQRERYLYHFTTSSSRENVLAALGHYQNRDGGFGHGLEADLRTRHSSVVATTVALQILACLDGRETKPAVDAIRYLITSYQGGNWQPINSLCNDAPFAPWWRYGQKTSDDERCAEQNPENTFVPNPGAEVLSYLIRYQVMSSDLPGLKYRAMDYLVNHDLDMHELLCYLRLFENPDLEATYKQAMLPYLLCNGYKLVKVHERDWEEYCLTPLMVITHPDSIYKNFFADVLEDNINFCIKHQNEDGSWSPTWSWGGEFPATWKTVETEIKSELTLKFLIKLGQFDRLE